MTSENIKAPLLYYIKLCASFQIHRCIQTGVTVRKCSIRVKIGGFLFLRDLEIWWMTLKNNTTPLLYYIKLCAAFQSHCHIKTGVTARKRSIRVKIGDFLSRVTLKIDVWPWKTIGHRDRICCFNLCASFHSQLWIQTGVTVRKRPIWVKINDFLAVWPWSLTDDLEEQ